MYTTIVSQPLPEYNNPRINKVVSETPANSEPHPDEEEVLDWDVTIETTPSRPSGTMQVKLEYRGRSKPIPAENPWTD